MRVRAAASLGVAQHVRLCDAWLHIRRDELRCSSHVRPRAARRRCATMWWMGRYPLRSASWRLLQGSVCFQHTLRAAARDDFKIFVLAWACRAPARLATKSASAGNRTRVTSMAAMYSTTRPLMPLPSCSGRASSAKLRRLGGQRCGCMPLLCCSLALEVATLLHPSSIRRANLQVSNLESLGPRVACPVLGLRSSRCGSPVSARAEFEKKGAIFAPGLVV